METQLCSLRHTRATTLAYTTRFVDAPVPPLFAGLGRNVEKKARITRTIKRRNTTGTFFTSTLLANGVVF